jgi:hypothetical protein
VRISIGVPAYNQGQYLAETLDSLLNQTVPPDEIVVSDNHSTDETPDILRRYEGRVRIIRPPEHLPMTAHFNFVVENLRGEWFSLLSSDDVAESGFVRHLSQAVTRDRNAVLVRGGWLTISPSGQRTGRCLLWSTSTVTEPPRTFVEQLQGSKVSFAAFLCRRSAWEEVGGFPTSLRFQVDRGLWLRLSAVGSFVTIHRSIARYRTGSANSNSASRWVGGAHDERVNALELVPGIADALGLSSRSAIRNAMRVAARRRLTAFLVQASAVADVDTRVNIAAELSPLADAIDQKGVLDEYRAGRPVRPIAGTWAVARGAVVVRAQLRSFAHGITRLV